MEENLLQLFNQFLPAFYKQPNFWISTIIGLASVIFSYLAFIEAGKAKRAASEAGKTVKIQTITIELSEIAQRLDKLDNNLSFPEARDLLNEISRRLRRLIAPFQSTQDLQGSCNALKNSLNDAKEALEGIRPQSDDESEIHASSIYFAIQGHFSNISSLVAEIMGLFEKRNIEVDQ